ncbi:hypothetical protein ILYODFUR_039167, partial [Ilyodon furcidens]
SFGLFHCLAKLVLRLSVCVFVPTPEGQVIVLLKDELSEVKHALRADFSPGCLFTSQFLRLKVSHHMMLLLCMVLCRSGSGNVKIPGIHANKFNLCQIRSKTLICHGRRALKQTPDRLIWAFLLNIGLCQDSRPNNLN